MPPALHVVGFPATAAQSPVALPAGLWSSVRLGVSDGKEGAAYK